ncbi:MAG: helix-turn-helix transcriptional regulator [Actinophytocola sp.]|uniref:helix-turn-helix domain-containing protein n=1 Tax=Actinophytocola sp. TaxID=1872138 RepID=UPI003C72E558
MTQPSQDVRRQVKAARGERDWTQKQLAQVARVSRGSVQNLENGIRLDQTTEAKIEGALGKPTGWLDSIRSGRVEDDAAPTRTAMEMPARVDPARATPGDLRRELAWWSRRLNSREDFERLNYLLDLSAALEDSPLSTQGGLQSDAQG